MKKVFKYYFNETKKQKYIFLVMMISMFLVVQLGLIIPYFLKLFADTMSQGSLNKSDTVSDLMNILYMISFFIFGEWLFWRINEYLVVFIQNNSMKNLELIAFRKINKRGIRFFKDNFAGSLSRKVSRFVTAYEILFDIFYFSFYYELIRIATIFIIFTLKKPLWGAIFLLWSIIFIISSYFYARWKLKYDIKAAEADSRVSAVMVDSISNYLTVKTFAKEEYEIDRFDKVSTYRKKKRIATWILHSHYNCVQALMMISLEILLIYFMIGWWAEGIFTAGDFFMFEIYILVLFRGLWDFGRRIQDIYEQLAYAKEMVNILEEKIEVEDISNAKTFQYKQGKIEFKNVSFKYSDGNRYLLKGFNLLINPGEKIALVGPSGGGKTTITKLLFRFHDINSGEILIDDQNIKDITQKSLREKISMVPQNPDMFHRTIAENITFGKKECEIKDIEKVAKLAHADKFISKLEKGYKTLVGERGVKLSGGERQRISIARAFLEDGRILVLDEATSALDSLTEKDIQESIKVLMKDRTSIVIAHRLSTILNMDRIVVIDKGKIVEIGSHQGLLSNKSLYANLWNHQIGGFLLD